MSRSLVLFFRVPAMLLALATHRRAAPLAAGGDPVASPARPAPRRSRSHPSPAAGEAP